MNSPSINESSRACYCCPLLGASAIRNITPDSSSDQTRHEFAVATISSLYPNRVFTNPESLPSLQQAFSNFNKAYPHFSETNHADRIREDEYYHLKHVCLDYIGHCLFSYSQLQSENQNFAPPFFDICHKSANLSSQMLLRGTQETEFESVMQRRIMSYMNISKEYYNLVFTTNQSSAFKILAESYPFHSNQNLVLVYDHKNEAVETMIESSKKRGARISFCWPNLKVESEKLRKKLVRKKGLFVSSIQSRVTGSRYAYSWMGIAKENGWHVFLDATALGPKEMDCLGLSIFKPDFLFCSFYKIFGQNPSGFGCLFVKKSTASVLKCPATATSTGIVSLLPTPRLWEEHLDETFELRSIPGNNFSEIEELETPFVSARSELTDQSTEIECRGLDHADSVGLATISCRARCLINWLVNAMMSLKHPNEISPVRIYGPKIEYDRGPTIAFNVFDWKGERIDHMLVQKLAERNNISLSCEFLFKKHEEESKREDFCSGISVVSASLGLLTSFEDVYRLWVFVSRFLDADFVEKERWRYRALNQQSIVI